MDLSLVEKFLESLLAGIESLTASPPVVLLGSIKLVSRGIIKIEKVEPRN